MRIVGVLLAAGSGSRFGGDKLLHPIPACPHPDPSPTSWARDRFGATSRNGLLGAAGIPSRDRSVGLPLPLAGEGRGEGEEASTTGRDPALPLPLAGEGWCEGAEAKAHVPATRAVPLGVVACRNLVDALPDTLAIVRPGDATLTALLRDAGARVLPCPDAVLGMGHTIACAIAASRDADGWVIALADMPWLRISTIRSIAGALRAGAAIVAPAHRGKRGNPVGFSSRYAEALASLEGDRGARDILARAGVALQTIEVDDDGVLRDVDVSGDL